MEVIKKGYQQTEIGVIPKDWEISNIGDCSIRIGDGIHSTPKYDESGDYFFINGNNLVNGEILINENTKRVSEEESLIHKRNLGFSTILLSINGTIGNIAFYQNEKIILGKSAAYINLNNKVNSYFFYQMLQTNFLKEYFKNELTGSTIKNLGLNSIRNTPIPLPPLPEQKAIAEVLSDMDNLITALERQIEKKRLVKQGAMQRLLTAGEDWEVRTLGEVGDFKNGINKSKDDFGFGYPFVNLMDVFGVNTINAEKKLGLVNSNNAERQMYELKKGDVLFIRSSVKPSGVGLTSLVEKDLLNTVFSGFIIRFRDKGFLADNFKKYCFYTKDFRDRLIGSSTVSANTNINQEALKKLELSFPKSLEEQTRIATILSDMDAAIEGLEKQLEKYRAVKVGLMQELLSGRKRLIDN